MSSTSHQLQRIDPNDAKGGSRRAGRRLWLTLACQFGIALLGCSSGSVSPGIPGLYVLERPTGVDTLELLANGRYVHTTVFEAHQVLTDSGAWRPTSIDHQDHLQIDNWVFWESPSPDSLMTGATSGTWYPSRVIRPDGRGSLSVDLEKNWVFVQVR